MPTTVIFNIFFILLVVQNHNDGLSGASLKTINDVFLRTQALQRLNLRRRTLFRLGIFSDL